MCWPRQTPPWPTASADSIHKKNYVLNTYFGIYSLSLISDTWQQPFGARSPIQAPLFTLAPHTATFALAQPWAQIYDPAHHWLISAGWSALPLIVLLLLMGGLRLKGHLAALAGMVTALVIALLVFRMPASMALLATVYGAAYGLFPVCWIVFPVLFMYQLVTRAGRFALLQQFLLGVAADSRLQLVLIAFSFGAFFEGAAGFGTPVAVCGTLLIGLGFRPLEAASLALLANTAPVAFGALGIPIVALHGVTGLDTLLLGRVVARMIAPFCFIIPFWLICAFAGFRRMLEVWPALLVAGGTYGLSLVLIATLHGPWLVDILSASASIIALILFLRVWKPRRILDASLKEIPNHSREPLSRNQLIRTALPWVIFVGCIVLWGIPHFSAWLDHLGAFPIHVHGLDQMVLRTPPAVPEPALEAAVFNLNLLSATGTGIFVAALLAGISMKLSLRDLAASFIETLTVIRFTLITVAALMAIGFIMRYSGMDATLGLAFARTGVLYPFFGTLIGWIGTASTGSDTSSNVLFGSLQKLTAQQLSLSPYLMTSANSAGGVMGKMVAPQSIVVATTATETYGSEGSILRRVFFHSVALACLVGLLVSLLAYWPTLTRLALR
ncbi:L-lactate permease [Edaphobacter bradus]|uniref:L-lactate permease n=1 Tax=Edaphobacter bradus TaxID=2259016 RepID=UPI0021E0D6A3|nr:L-lactate permease [Edaphobacter bradus]